MKIQPVNMLCKPSKPCFTSRERRENTDRAVTVTDLYEMEDRINLQNKELVKQQNEKLGNILKNMIKMLYSNEYFFYERALEASEDLPVTEI